MKINLDHYNKMYDALKTIANGYQTPDQLKRSSKQQWGLDYEEILEMAYENIQQLAKEATKKVRRYKCPVKVLSNERDDKSSVATGDAQ